MNMKNFYRNNITVDWETGDTKVINLVVLNAKPGVECMKMCGLFNIKPTSLMMAGGGESSLIESQDYINFAANKTGKSGWFIDSNSYVHDAGIVIMYYPDIEPMLDEIREEFPQFLEQIPNSKTKEVESSSSLYKLLGMEAIDDL